MNASRTRREVATVPLISVVICTRNRAELLPDAIRSVLDQDVPRETFEVIVVDNASTDRTPAVVRHLDGQGALRYVREPTIGLNRARNAGWKRARGRYVAYLDDDAVAAPGWVRAVRRAFETTPRPGIVGGRVDPVWEAERPRWLSDELAPGLTIVDWSPGAHFIADVRREWLVGANFAVSTDLLAALGGFHEALGRRGTRLLSSEETFLQQQAIRRGHRCLYYPAMAVRHRVPRARLSKRWFRRRYFWQGVSDATMELIEHAHSPLQRLRLALRRATRLLASPRRLANLVWPTSDPDRFTRKCFTLIDVGHIAGLLGAARP